MYSSLPIAWPVIVPVQIPASEAFTALATPKSMIRARGFPSSIATSTFDGERSR